MSPLRYILFLILPLAGIAVAAVTPRQLPGDAVWYFHTDLAELRRSEGGRHLYHWLDGEVYAEVRQELGIDLDQEADSVTAFADATLGTVIVLEGAITQSTRDKLLALATLKATTLATLSHDGKTFYHAAGEAGRAGRRALDDFHEAAYFSFDVPDKLIVTSNRDQMQALLEREGRLPDVGSPADALFVLTADKSFMQAGVRTSALAKESGGWESNILSNTEQVALLVADRGGLIALEAQLVSRDPVMARSLAGIINGLIGLQMLNSNADPNLLALMQNAKINVEDKLLSLEAVIDPDIVVDALED